MVKLDLNATNLVSDSLALLKRIRASGDPFVIYMFEMATRALIEANTPKERKAASKQRKSVCIGM